METARIEKRIGVRASAERIWEIVERRLLPEAARLNEDAAP